MSFNKNIITTYTAQIVSVFCWFLCAVMAARMLGAYGQGELALYNNFISITTLVFGLGLPATLVHFIAAKKIAKDQIFSLLSAILLIGIVFISLILFSAQIFSIHFLPTLFYNKPTWLLLLIAHIAFVMMNVFLVAIMQAEEAFRKAGKMVVLSCIIQTCLYALLYFSVIDLQNFTLEWICIAMLIPQLIQMILSLFMVSKINNEYFNWSSIQLYLLKPLFIFSALAFSTNVIQFLSYKMDIWFLNAYHGKQIIGVYSLAAAFAQMLWLLPSAIQSVLYAYMSTNTNAQENIQKTIKTTNQIGLYAITAGILGFIASYFLVPLLFGEEFRASVKLMGLLLLGIVPFCLSMAISAYFAASGYIKINFYSAVLGFVVCLFADIILIPPYGATGAAIASVLSYISTVLYLLVRFRFITR